MKQSKREVDYRKGTMSRRCDNCTMWRKGTCTAVEGRIFPDGVCDLFKRRD